MADSEGCVYEFSEGIKDSTGLLLEAIHVTLWQRIQPQLPILYSKVID